MLALLVTAGFGVGVGGVGLSEMLLPRFFFDVVFQFR